MDTTMPAGPEPPTPVISYRRNGKLFSCEPCRRGKLRCDHASPVCGRCARRNKSDQCIYHPAPLTKQHTSPGPDSPRPSLPPPSVRNGAAVEPYPTLNLHRMPSGLVSPPSSNGPQHRLNSFRPPVTPMPPTPIEDGRSSSFTTCTESNNMSFREGKVGFLGPTSYSAVFTENPGSLGIDLSEEPHDDLSNLPPISPEKIQQGAEVLALLRDMPLYEKLNQRLFDICDGIVVGQPIFRIWVDEMWSEFGPILTEGKPEQLRTLSELVWRNTRRPMQTSGQMTAREWAKSASGRNLRWEIVGLTLSMAGLIAANLSNWDAIFDQVRERYIDRATFAERMRKASEFCLCFCYESEVLNDIYICFMYKDLVLVECLKGDAHYATWQRTGEICDAIVAMGLHQGNKVDADTPFWLAELRKKIFISAYGHDKSVASFLGRPPRLSHRYCKMDMPLDLSDEESILEGEELQMALAKLDENGWNTSGCLHRTTWIRVWFQHCRLREDILEIALGSDDEGITFRAEQIRQKLGHLQDSFPDFMRVSPEEILNKSGPISSASPYGFSNTGKTMRQINDVFTLLCVHAGILHTEFLLQRALINRGQNDYKELIPVSRRILSLVLLAQSRRDFFRDFQGELTYLLTVYGLPSAGVLAVELLKQEQIRHYAHDLLPRSETIQDLSVFVSSLASVGPGEGNFSICNQGRRALRKVLDQILSPHNTAMPVPAMGADNRTGQGNASGGGAGGGGGFDDMSLVFPTGNDADFLQWLENVEWDKASLGVPVQQQQMQGQGQGQGERGV